MTNKEIIARLENPTKHYNIQELKHLARDNNINVRRNISKPDLINTLGERNLITTTPITAQESNLGVRVENIPNNLTGYDSHLFIKKLGSPDEKENIDCIPNNEEKYISFSKTIKAGHYTNKKGEIKDKTFKIVFKDSLKFMGSSLGALVNNLPKDAFKNLLKYYTPEQAEILKQKGFYPYEYMDTEEKFNDTKLPPREAFYSKLLGRGITKADYKHAWNVWDTFKMKTFKEYHELYNVTDVLLLADVFENFRNSSLKTYGLDPVYYFYCSWIGLGCLFKNNGCRIRIIKRSRYVINV